MAYELVSRGYHCLCGKGKIINEWQEHDTYPHHHISGGDWRIECPECAENFTFDRWYSNVVRKSTGEKTPLLSLSRIDLGKL